MCKHVWRIAYVWQVAYEQQHFATVFSVPSKTMRRWFWLFFPVRFVVVLFYHNFVTGGAAVMSFHSSATFAAHWTVATLNLSSCICQLCCTSDFTDEIKFKGKQRKGNQTRHIMFQHITTVVSFSVIVLHLLIPPPKLVFVFVYKFSPFSPSLCYSSLTRSK